MTTTTQTTRIINDLIKSGLRREDFSVKANRRRIKGEDGKKHTEFLPGCHITIRKDDYRDLYKNLLQNNFDLIIYYDFQDNKISCLPASVVSEFSSFGVIYYVPGNAPEGMNYADLQTTEFKFAVVHHDDMVITRIKSTIFGLGKAIQEELQKNTNRLAFYFAWLESGCQIIRED